MGMNYEKDVLEELMCNEIKMIESKYATSKKEMDIADLQKLDVLYHTLKSKATYDAMKDAQEYGFDQGQMSGRRGYSGRMSGYNYPDQNYSGSWMGPPRWEPGPRW